MKKLILLSVLFLLSFNAMAQHAEIRLNTPLRGYPEGAIIGIELDDQTLTPVDEYWAARLRDAKHDNCITFYTN